MRSLLSLHVQMTNPVRGNRVARLRRVQIGASPKVALLLIIKFLHDLRPLLV